MCIRDRQHSLHSDEGTHTPWFSTRVRAPSNHLLPTAPSFGTTRACRVYKHASPTTEAGVSCHMCLPVKA
eukprot:9266982-Alexandrium_andersonii.AAC.1